MPIRANSAALPACDLRRPTVAWGPDVTGPLAWLQAVLVGLVTVAVFWTPGALVIHGWGWRAGRLAGAAVAPLVTCGLFGGAALLSTSTLRWDARAALLVTGLGWASGVVWRRVRGAQRAPARPRPRVAAGLVAAVAVGIALQLVPVAVGAERPDGWLTAHDLTFHLAAVDYVRRTGLGSSLHLMTAASAEGSLGGFYGAGWHDVAALVPVWPWRPLVLNATVVFPIVVEWTLALTFLCRTIVPKRPGAVIWAPLLGSAGVALPLTIVLFPEGMVPNALGLAFAPAAIAVAVLATRPGRPPIPVLAAVALGVALVHPNALATVVVALLPAAAMVAWRRRREGRFVALAATALVVAGLVMVLVSRTPQFRAVTTYPAEPAVRLGKVLVQIASGNATGQGSATGYLVVVAGMVGTGLACRQRDARWAWVAAWVFPLLYLAASSSIPYLKDADRIWYGEPRRFTPMIGALFVPPAAVVLDMAWTVLSRWTQRESRPVWVPRAGIALVTVASMFGGALAFSDLVRASYDPGGGLHSLAGGAELQMADRLATELDHRRAVLGSPFSGAANLQERIGQRVAPPAETGEPDTDVAYLARSLSQLAVDPGVCAAVRRLGVGYLYVDPQPWNIRPWIVDVRVPPKHGVRLIDSGGTASVYEITAC